MLGVKDAGSGRYIAVLTNFATHGWLYACPLISADISGACSAFVGDRLERDHPGVVALYCPGTHSNIVTVQNQRYPAGPAGGGPGGARVAAAAAPPAVGEYPDTTAKREAWFKTELLRFGEILGEATLEGLRHSGAPRGSERVGGSSHVVDAPLYESYLADILAERKGTPNEGALPPTDLTMATEVQVLEVGADLRFVGLPSEVYVEYGLEIKARTRFKHTFVFSYCNDYFADIVTQEAVDDGTCPDLDWAKVGPGVRGEIMAALEPRLFGKVPVD